MRWTFLLSVFASVIFGWSASQLEEIEKICDVIPKEELHKLQNLPQELKDILENYAKSRNVEFKKVLTEKYGFGKETVDKINSTEPLESFVLIHQMNLHRDVISKIEEARYIPQNKTEQLKPSIGGEELLKNLSLKLQDFFETNIGREEKLLENLSLKVQDLLKNNFESKNQKLKNVLLNSGFNSDEIGQLDPNEPTEGLILRHQMNLHQDTKSMLKEIKELLKSQNLCKTEKRPTDCCDLYLSGKNTSGVYQIYPNSTDPVEVFCDMETQGGGWTVFLSRGNNFPKLNFTRNWKDYKKGFGSAAAEYWLGNELLSWLTQNRNYSIRMDASNVNGTAIWNKWGIFKVDSELSKYKLRMPPDLESTAHHDLIYPNGIKFSSFDNDNDESDEENCASLLKGGWWYKTCFDSNPTGIHTDTTKTGINLRRWSHDYFGYEDPFLADELQMKIRPQNCHKIANV